MCTHIQLHVYTIFSYAKKKKKSYIENELLPYLQGCLNLIYLSEIAIENTTKTRMSVSYLFLDTDIDEPL